MLLQHLHETRLAAFRKNILFSGALSINSNATMNFNLIGLSLEIKLFLVSMIQGTNSFSFTPIPKGLVSSFNYFIPIC